MIGFFVLAFLAFHQGISKDVTPPTCRFCPGDIVREEPNAYERVSWDDLKCSDNSNNPPVITSNYTNGGAGPSMQKRNGFKEFFFNGNRTHSEIVTALKQNLLTITKGPKVPPIYVYCLHEACTPQKVQVYLS